MFEVVLLGSNLFLDDQRIRPREIRYGATVQRTTYIINQSINQSNNQFDYYKELISLPTSESMQGFRSGSQLIYMLIYL